MEKIKYIFLMSCMFIITGISISAQSINSSTDSNTTAKESKNSSVAEIRTALNQIQSLTQSMDSEVQKLESIQATVDAANQERDNYKKACVDFASNAMVTFLNSPYYANTSAFLASIDKKKWILEEEVKIEIQYNLLKKYKDLNDKLLKFMEEVNTAAKTPGYENDVKNSLANNGHLNIESLDDLNSIPFLRRIITKIEARMNNYRIGSNENFDDFIFILKSGTSK